MLMFLLSFFFLRRLQVRSPTGVHGRAASGALHEATSSPDTSGSTPEQSHSNAVTATGERAGKRSTIADTYLGRPFHTRKNVEKVELEVEK